MRSYFLFLVFLQELLAGARRDDGVVASRTTTLRAAGAGVPEAQLARSRLRCWLGHLPSHIERSKADIPQTEHDTEDPDSRSPVPLHFGQLRTPPCSDDVPVPPQERHGIMSLASGPSSSHLWLGSGPQVKMVVTCATRRRSKGTRSCGSTPTPCWLVLEKSPPTRSRIRWRLACCGGRS